ncbi:hypothetical protein OPQ81_011873 [Rhizoctonia solani]|nr:hypothetical protein OPQ81_011873 [Rhizoctonia solani]
MAYLASIFSLEPGKKIPSATFEVIFERWVGTTRGDFITSTKNLLFPSAYLPSNRGTNIDLSPTKPGLVVISISKGRS